MYAFENYNAFCRKFCDKYGYPRYTKEDYEGFRVCADEWYVLDSRRGEFSTDVPLENPVKIKIPKRS